MYGIAAEIAEEILVLFEDRNGHSRAASRKLSIMPAGPPPTTQQVVLKSRFIACGSRCGASCPPSVSSVTSFSGGIRVPFSIHKIISLKS